MLILEIVEAIMDSNPDYYYGIECEEEVIQLPTKDLSLLCNQKEGDKYVGIDNLDGGEVIFFIKQEVIAIEYQPVGYLVFNNCAEGIERLDDWGRRLSPIIEPILIKKYDYTPFIFPEDE